MNQLEDDPAGPAARPPQQAELEAARSHYFDLYERAPLAYLTVSADGRILEANRHAVGLLAGSGEALAEQPLIRFILAPDQEIFYLYRKQFLKTSEPYTCELRMLGPNGAPFLAQLTVCATPGGAAGAAPPGSRMMLVDITERRRVERQKLTFDLEIQQNQKRDGIGQLAGGIAHDFNNLLTAILGNAGMGAVAAAEHRDPAPYFQAIEHAAMKAADLTAQMLAYAGRGKYWVTDVDLNLAIRETTRILSAAFPPAVTFQLDLADRMPFVSGDSAQILQVLMNLVTNASEAFAAGAGGRIIVRTRAERIPEGPLKPGCWVLPPRPGCYGSLEVADTGSGMPAEVLARAFEPFYTTKFAGRGLGLAAVAGILANHGGGLLARSDPGQGSSFKLFLPVTKEARTDPVFEARPAWRGQGRLLLADPDPAARRTARSMAEQFGFEVLEARDGPDAIATFGLQHRTLVLVLLGLASLHQGREAIRAMRSLDPGVPLVLCGPEEVRAADPARPGLEEFIHQPYRLAEIQGLLQRTLARRSS